MAQKQLHPREIFGRPVQLGAGMFPRGVKAALLTAARCEDLTNTASGLATIPVEVMPRCIKGGKSCEGLTGFCAEWYLPHFATPAVNGQHPSMDITLFDGQCFADAQTRVSAQEEQGGQRRITVWEDKIDFGEVRRILDDAWAGLGSLGT